MRSETETDRLDRNWYSLLQKLRVTRTGVQLLTGFLPTPPFRNCFATLDHALQATYLVTVGCSLVGTVLLLAPVGVARVDWGEPTSL